MPTLRNAIACFAALTVIGIAGAPASATVGVYVNDYSALSGNTNYVGYNFSIPNGYALTGAYKYVACRSDVPCAITQMVTPDEPTGLAYAASASAGMSDTDQGGFSSGSGFARVGLSTGELGAYATGTYRSAFGQGSGISVRAFATMNDFVDFTVAGATGTTVTPISVMLALDGLMTRVNTFTDGSAASLLRFGGAEFYATINYRDKPEPGIYTSGASGWADYTLTETSDGLIFTGTYNLIGASQRLEFGEFLDVQCGNGMVCDYANTAAFTMSLPTNVSYTSQSGVFLTALSAVPEPGTWAMTILGFGVIGGAVRRRRVVAAQPALG